MDIKKRGRYIGVIGALVIHALLLTLLALVYIVVPEPEEESGIPILMGEVDHALGGERVDHFVDVDILPQEELIEPVDVEEVDQELITQAEEETVAIEPKKEKKVQDKPKPVEKTPEELAEEARIREQERIAKERREAEEAARLRVAGAFGKGASMDSKDLASEKVKNAFDNVPVGGTSASGQSGYGTFDLGGRSIGRGGLPRPVYNVEEEGKVVVTITVNPAGNVISTSINRQTNTVNSTLRQAAEQAAKKAQFNRINGVDNQIGTITYYFNLK